MKPFAVGAAWDVRRAKAHGPKEAVNRQPKEAETQVEGRLDRLTLAASLSLVKVYESRIAKLEREKLVRTRQGAKLLPEKGRLAEFIELSLELLASHWNIFKNLPPPHVRRPSDWHFRGPFDAAAKTNAQVLQSPMLSGP
jgi:hypothetical protein